MPFHQPNQVRYYTFESLDDAGVKHAVFTRRGGVSPAPWKSLNLGGTVGDDPFRVRENRQKALSELGIEAKSVYDVWQIHSSEVVCAESPRLADAPHSKADAILTDCPQVTLLMRFADCVPVLLYDPIRRVAGIVHAGWQGTVKKVVCAAVERMRIRYSSLPQDLLAAIGPSIGPDHYIVGSDVTNQVHSAFGQNADMLVPEFGGVVKLNLWIANRLLLEQMGVRNIEVCNICTACHLEDWFSHRGEHGKTGRFGVLICL